MNQSLFFVFACLLMGVGHLPANAKPMRAAGKTISPCRTQQTDTTRLQYQYLISKNPAGGFGYMVFGNGNMLIDQPTIPGMPGNKGFADTAQAGKCARLAIDKMRKGQMPPTITSSELKKLGVLPTNRKIP